MEMRFHAPLSEISPLAQIPVVRLEGGVPRITLLVGFSSARRRQLAERDSRLPGHREELVFLIFSTFSFFSRFQIFHSKLLLPMRPKLSTFSAASSVFVFAPLSLQLFACFILSFPSFVPPYFTPRRAGVLGTGFSPRRILRH